MVLENVHTNPTKSLWKFSGGGEGGGKKENKLLKRTFKLTETSRGVGVGVGGFDQRNPSWGLWGHFLKQKRIQV